VHILVSLIAYIVDRAIGEFSFITHPVVWMGRYISWFENRFYKDELLAGVWLWVSLVFIVGVLSCSIEYLLGNSWLGILIQGVIASSAIASKMLYESVKDIIKNPNHIKYLVSRDTKDLTPSDINKASIETYAENLSDGVIAPLFYLLLFGLCGAFVYKAINTLDSMVGYRNDKYERFGKFSAKADDIANFIPSRITALLILLLNFKLEKLPQSIKQGSKHESPNAGYPISAMGLTLNVKLGGDTSYFGKIKHKPTFGEGREEITTDDIHKALGMQKWLDVILIFILSIILLYTLHHR